MPRWFGPMPGPRNVPADRMTTAGDGDTLSIAVSALTDGAMLQALLPPHCQIWGEPVVTVSANFLTNLGWLAGRGYNIVWVTIPVEFAGEEQMRRGDFMPVLWESRADPIITGREELGFAKLYAEIDGPGPSEDRFDVSASWDGFRFFDLQARGIAEAVAPPVQRPEVEGTLHYKFVPRTGGQGEADVEYMVLMPPPEPPRPGEGTASVRRYTGEGSFAFHAARWEDMPTQYPVVNALAALPLLEFRSAQVTFTSVRAGSTGALDGATPVR